MTYTVIDASTLSTGVVPEVFVNQCNALIKEGYVPHGSLAVVYKAENGRCHLYQAFVRQGDSTKQTD